MAPKQLDKILGRVPPSRRAFLRQVLAGTAFVTPLMSSFSMGGLAFGFPPYPPRRAPGCGNTLYYSSNQAQGNNPPPDTTQQVSSAYTGPSRFRAQLTIAGNQPAGRAALELVLDAARANLVYRLRTTVQLVTSINDQLTIQTPQGTYVSFGLTTVYNGYLPGSLLPPEGMSCSLEALLVALAAGQGTATLTMQAAGQTLTGPIVAAT